MKGILFRGKRVDNGKWVFGSYAQANTHWHEHGKHNDWIITRAIQNGGFFNVIGRHAVIPSTVGQYTGVTDSYGTKVFEGDFIAHEFSSIEIPCFIEYLEVYYDEETARYYAGSYPLSEIIQGREVVGNIYDNPEFGTEA